MSLGLHTEITMNHEYKFVKLTTSKRTALHELSHEANGEGGRILTSNRDWNFKIYMSGVGITEDRTIIWWEPTESVILFVCFWLLDQISTFLYNCLVAVDNPERFVCS